ncbi:MAG: iron ABC transporter permease [Planctomycetota bacterium]
MSNRRSPMIGLVVLTILLVLMIPLRVLIDRAPDGSLGFAWPEASYASFRWMALAGGMVVGVALGVSGGLLQSMLRNPLASPYILGVSSGAGLGIMVGLYLASIGRVTMHSTFETIPAVLGALVVLGLVYAFGRRDRRLDPVTVILIGVVISTMCGAGMMLLQSLVPAGLRGEFLRWLMGRIPEALPMSTLMICTAITGIGLIWSIRIGRAMDVAVLPDDECQTAGVSIAQLRTLQFVLAGMLAAVAVTIAGPIGFVGLIAPHTARLLVGPTHRPRIIGAALAGAVLVIGSDVARQVIDLGHGRLPIGIFTALIGGPVFLWLLLSGRAE